jgi:hypothetical protein
MQNHFQLSDQDFQATFAAAAFEPALFTHEAHLRLAWIHLRQYGVEQAIEHITAQLKAYVEKLGAADKYNETVTIAAIRTVDHFMRKSASDNFADFIHEFPRLKYNFKELLSFHYKKDVFTSEQARREYLEPDLLPFD